LTVVMLFCFHGANFLSLKLTEGLRVKAHTNAKMYFTAALVFALGLFAALFFTPSAFSSKGWMTLILPLLAAAAMIISRVMMEGKREGRAFVASSLAVVLTVAALFVALFPNVMLSSTNPANSLTIYNASSAPYTLTVMSIIAAIMVPVVVAYQAWTYIVFRKRVKADAKTLTY
jgi:cytochrome d ubiquinol oxidase subunit II